MFDRVRSVGAEESNSAGSRPALGRNAGHEQGPGKGGCSHCGARVGELRRGRCWGCYQVWSGLRPVGRGARCVVCYERRSDLLRLMEVRGRWLPFCHGCGARSASLPALPYTVDGLRRALARERRWEDRRLEAYDVRVEASDRRELDRRFRPVGPSGLAAAGADAWTDSDELNWDPRWLPDALPPEGVGETADAAGPPQPGEVDLDLDASQVEVIEMSPMAEAAPGSRAPG